MANFKQATAYRNNQWEYVWVWNGIKHITLPTVRKNHRGWRLINKPRNFAKLNRKAESSELYNILYWRPKSNWHCKIWSW